MDTTCGQRLPVVLDTQVHGALSDTGRDENTRTELRKRRPLSLGSLPMRIPVLSGKELSTASQLRNIGQPLPQTKRSR